MNETTLAQSFGCSRHVVGLDINESEVTLDCTILNLYKVFGLFIIIIGTVGHILSILVVALEQTFRHQSSGVYIIALSIAGLMAIYTGLLRWVIQGYTRWEADLRLLSDAGCYAHSILTYLSLHLIAWFQATIALDRVFHVALPALHPSFYRRRCTWKHGLVIVCVLAVLALALNLFLLSVLKFDNERHECSYSDEIIGKTWSAIDLVSFSLLPSAVIIICNILIIVTVSRSKVNSENKNNVVQKTKRSVTIMLMTVNFVFIVTTVPVSVMQLIDRSSYTDAENVRFELPSTVSYLIQYLGTASTFIIYCLSGKKFRSAVKSWFIKKKPMVTKTECNTMLTMYEVS